MLGQCMWGLWCTQWHWDRFLSRNFTFFCQYRSTNAPYLPSSTRCYYWTGMGWNLGTFPKKGMLLRKSRALERSYRTKYFGRRAFFGCSNESKTRESSFHPRDLQFLHRSSKSCRNTGLVFTGRGKRHSIDLFTTGRYTIREYVQLFEDRRRRWANDWQQKPIPEKNGNNRSWNYALQRIVACRCQKFVWN